jgi:hypothetical protein
MNANDFQAAFAAQMSNSLVEGQFIPAKPEEETTISGYINQGRIHGNGWDARLGGIIIAEGGVKIEVHVVGQFDFDNLLEKGRNNYHKNLPATFTGWKVELNSNGYTDWICKTPVYRVNTPLNEIRVARKIYGENAAYIGSTKKVNPEYVVRTFSGVNPDADKIEW